MAHGDRPARSDRIEGSAERPQLEIAAHERRGLREVVAGPRRLTRTRAVARTEAAQDLRAADAVFRVPADELLAEQVEVVGNVLRTIARGARLDRPLQRQDLG